MQIATFFRKTMYHSYEMPAVFCDYCVCNNEPYDITLDTNTTFMVILLRLPVVGSWSDIPDPIF